MIGATGLLGGYLTALRLVCTADSVFYIADKNEDSLSGQFERLVRYCAQHAYPEIPMKYIEERIRLHLRPALVDRRREDLGLLSELQGPADEVWCLQTKACPSDHTRGKTANLPEMLSTLGKIRATEFNYVTMDTRTDSYVVERCSAHDIGWRIFHVALVAAGAPVGMATGGEGFVQFLDALFDLKKEIDERLPQYFDYQALRYRTPPNHTGVNIIRTHQAAQMIMRIAEQPGTVGRCFRIAAPQDTPFANICEHVGAAYGLSLLAVDGQEALNAVDAQFEDRLQGFQEVLPIATEEGVGEDGWDAAGIAPESLFIHEKAQIALFEEIRSLQEAARKARDERVAAFPGSLIKKTIARGSGDLTYYVGGTGAPPIVLLSAVGLGPDIWYRLVDYLMPRNQVVLLEPRSTNCPQQLFGIADQVEDLEAVFCAEGIKRCDVTAWCTGSKVAIEFYLRNTSMLRSLVFINSSFKCFGSPAEHVTPYERSFEPICRILEQRPEMAHSVLLSLGSKSSDNENELVTGTDSWCVAAAALSQTNTELRDYVLAPFRNESTLLSYSRQLLDLWTYDSLAKAGQVGVPVLLVAAEYDRIAAPEVSQTVACLFPYARHVLIKGATHYCAYDRPDLIASLIVEFLSSLDLIMGGKA